MAIEPRYIDLKDVDLLTEQPHVWFQNRRQAFGLGRFLKRKAIGPMFIGVDDVLIPDRRATHQVKRRALVVVALVEVYARQTPRLHVSDVLLHDRTATDE